MVLPQSFEELADDVKEVKDRRVPHEVEGDAGPEMLSIVKQDVEGGSIRPHVSKG